MRTLCAIVVASCAAWLAQADGTQAQDSDPFPYTAFATTDDLYVRSGPGKNYYPTEKLSKGDAVEVYRHDPGGWFAIRPPQGSFSWVPAEALKPTGDGLAVVLNDRTQCYVGTSFSSARDVHQVRLDKDEVVEILDIKQIGEGENVQSWCQIAPPAGEFRWVAGKYVSRELPSGLSTNVASDRDARGRKTDPIDEDRARFRSQHGEAWSNRSAADIEKARSAAAGPVAPADPLQAELLSIDLELSKVAGADPALWEFTAIRRRSEAALERAETALERGQVRLVLNRIARFEDIKRRYDLLGQPQNAGAIAAARPPVLPVDEPARFDGVGKLTPVVAQRPNAPRYALVNDANQVVSFITPSPGMNLQPYVGRQVGITGQRGYMPELKKPHVTAQRVSVVEGTVVR